MDSFNVIRSYSKRSCSFIKNLNRNNEKKIQVDIKHIVDENNILFKEITLRFQKIIIMLFQILY